MTAERRPFVPADAAAIPVRPDPAPPIRLSPMARRVAANKAAARRLVDETSNAGARPATIQKEIDR